MVECMRSIVAAGIGGMVEKVKYKSIHASIHRRLSGGFFCLSDIKKWPLVQ